MRLRLLSICTLLCVACTAEQDFGFPSSKTAPNDAVGRVGGSGAGAQPDDGSLAEWHWLNPPRGPSALRGVASTGPTDTWLAGDGGVVLHWDGAQMTTARQGASDESLYAAWAIGPKDVWIGGTRASGGVFLHYDGSSFAATELGAVPVSVWGAAPNDVWAVVARQDGATDIVHWDGTAWSTPVPLLGVSGAVRLRDIYGLDASRVFAVGDDGVVLRLSTSSTGVRAFSRETSVTGAGPFDPSLHYFAVWGPTGPAFSTSGRVWAAFVSNDGFGVSVVDTGTAPSVPAWRLLQRGVDTYGTSAVVHAAGDASSCAAPILAALKDGPRRRGHLFSGSALGSSWSPTFGLLSTDLLDDNASCGDGKFGLWTLGGNAALSPDVSAIGGIWPSYAGSALPPADAAVLGLAFDGREVVAAGSAGAFLETSPLSGDALPEAPILQPAEPGVLAAPLVAVAAVSADEAWGASKVTTVSGKRGPLMHFRDGFWGTVPGIRGDVQAVSASGGTVWAAGWTDRLEQNGVSGTAGFIAQGDGETFKQHVVEGCDSLTSVAGVGPGEAWAVGFGAPYDWTLPSLCIVHVTPSGVERVPTPDAFAATLVNFQLTDGTEDWERHIDGASVAAAGPSEVYVFAEGETKGFGAYASLSKRIRAVLRWNGTSFAPILDAPDLVVGAAPPPLVASGHDDVLLGAAGVMQFDGARWSALSLPSTSFLTDLARLDASQRIALVAGPGTSELRTLWDGAWTSSLSVPVPMSALSRAPDGSVWMVGAGGATARARRLVPIPPR